MVILPGVPLGHTVLPTPLRFPERSCLVLQIDPAGILHALGCCPTSRGLVVSLPRFVPHAKLNLVLETPWETAPHSEQKASPPAVHSLWEGCRFIIQLRVGTEPELLAEQGFWGRVFPVVPSFGKVPA